MYLQANGIFTAGTTAADPVGIECKRDRNRINEMNIFLFAGAMAAPVEFSFPIGAKHGNIRPYPRCWDGGVVVA